MNKKIEDLAFHCISTWKLYTFKHAYLLAVINTIFGPNETFPNY